MFVDYDTKLRVWTLFALLIPGPAWAQSSPAPLTLDAALSEALDRNPDLVALRRMSDVTTHRPAQERALPPPMLEGQIWQWPINTLNPAHTNMYMLTVTQDLPGRGKRDLHVAVAEKDTAIARSDVDVRARDVLADVKRTYAELAFVRRATTIHESSADVLRQFIDLSTAKYESGLVPQRDVVKAILELSNLHQELITFGERIALAEAVLNSLLGRPPDAAIGPLDQAGPIETVPAPADLQELALGHQPALRAALLDRERAEAARAVTQAGTKPDFLVSGGYMLLPDGRDAWTGSFGITWPRAPWSRAKLTAQVAQSDAEIDAARARERAAESRSRLEVQEASVRLRSAQRRAELLERTILPQSQQALEASRLAYESDRADILALMDGRRTLLDAQMAYYEAVRDTAVAAADLDRAVGLDIVTPRPSAMPMPVATRRLP